MRNRTDTHLSSLALLQSAESSKGDWDWTKYKVGCSQNGHPSRLGRTKQEAVRLGDKIEFREN